MLNDEAKLSDVGVREQTHLRVVRANPVVAMGAGGRVNVKAVSSKQQIFSLWLQRGLLFAVLFCVLFSVVAPIFDSDEDESWGLGFVRYMATVWQWLLGGVGFALIMSIYSILTQ